jgi:hypothetical protein
MCLTALCPTGDLTIVSSPVKVRISYVLGEKSKHPGMGAKLVGFDKEPSTAFSEKEADSAAEASRRLGLTNMRPN